MTLVGNTQGTYTIRLSGTYYDPPIEVKPVAGKTNEWTLSMPASDVLLTPVYSAATIYRMVGTTETESSYETFKEAFLAAQDGDVIKLDWDVTLTEQLQTPSEGDGLEFTIDFNGYTITGGTHNIIILSNSGDRLTFTDSSADQLGGYITSTVGFTEGSKIIFDAGRYKISTFDAEPLNKKRAYLTDFYDLAEGKEFVDIAGAPDTKGFMVYVDYKTYELSIGPKKFATFYDDHNVKLAEGTDISFYTIKGDGINAERTKVTPTQISGNIIGPETPTLVYNGSDAKQTVKLKVTSENATSLMHAGAFKGTAADKPFTADDMADYDFFVLSGGKAFAPVYSAGTISAHKCWLQFDKQQQAGARSLSIVFDNETTGVNEVIEVLGKPSDQGRANEVIDDTIYDLNGRKLNAAPKRKGVYVKNGKKVVK